MSPSLTSKALKNSLTGALANCGGVNLRTRRYAGRFAEPGLSEQEYLGLCHSLIFPNGVRKTTAPGRNEKLVAMALRSLDVGEEPLRVLDIGAAIGLDARSNLAEIERVHAVQEYVLGDRFPRILLDRERGLVFDEDGHLLQVKRRGYFVSVYFEYNYPFQRWLNLPRRLYPEWLKRRYSNFGSQRLEPVDIVLPELHVDDPSSKFRLKRMDVFQPIEGTYDFILCMHLLVPRYFSQEVIERGVARLFAALKPGGVLLTGSSEAPRIITRPRTSS